MAGSEAARSEHERSLAAEALRQVEQTVEIPQLQTVVKSSIILEGRFLRHRLFFWPLT